MVQEVRCHFLHHGDSWSLAPQLPQSPSQQDPDEATCSGLPGDLLICIGAIPILGIRPVDAW